MHPRPLESSLDNEFIGALNDAGANRPALCLELWVLHQRSSFLEVLDMPFDAFLLSQ